MLTAKKDYHANAIHYLLRNSQCLLKSMEMQVYRRRYKTQSFQTCLEQVA